MSPDAQSQYLRKLDEYEPSWITEPKWQLLVGTIIASLILAAGLVPLYAATSETRARQSADRQQQVRADAEIRREVHASEVKIVCGISNYVDIVTAPGDLKLATDDASRARVLANNQQRAVARAQFRSTQPASIIDECRLAP